MPWIFLIAVAATTISTPLWRSALKGSAWTDVPRADRYHQRSTPKIGGFAWLTGLLIALVASLAISGTAISAPSFLVIVLGMLLGFALGLADERGLIEVRRKWLFQSLILVLMILAIPFLFRESGAIGPAHLWHSPSGDGGAGLIRLAIALLTALALQLALNIFDNLDGAVGSVSLFGFGLLAHLLRGTPDLALIAVAGAGASLGFLFWNRPPARIFLGNAGSQTLALLAGVLVFVALTVGPGPVAPVRWVVLLPFAWPLVDLGYVTLSRPLRGRAPWQGGRDHTTHELARRLGSDRGAAFLIGLLAAVGSGLAVLLLGAR